ncbi:MAG: hypothetical protein GY749_07635 [Desulfobacteraceae bacterium]|nr:hypothetical protein [Desulfobacteraceae bacterium]
MINEIQEASNHMGIASETSSRGIQDGLESFSKIACLLHEILVGAQSTTNAAKQISLSTQQQKTATDQVVIALEDIAEGARHISSSINEISSISSNLKELSDNLQGLMKKFVLE